MSPLAQAEKAYREARAQARKGLRAMGNRPRKVEKTRISVTLTRPYVEALECLIQEGI